MGLLTYGTKPLGEVTYGEGTFYNTVGQGGLNLIRRYTDWRSFWSIIVPGNFGGGIGFTDLFFYDATVGGGDLISTDGQGGLNLIRRYAPGELRTTWRIIVPGNFGGGTGFTDLFFYDPFEDGGGGEFISIINGQGDLRLIRRRTDLPSALWSAIVPGNFGGGTGFTDLFVYYVVNSPFAPIPPSPGVEGGVGEFYSTDGQGGTKLLQRHNLEVVQSPFGGTILEWGPFIRPL